jgi:hypothetical protein
MLPKLKDICGTSGMLWITYPKGNSKVKTDVNRDIICKCALTLGSRGVAMISETNVVSATPKTMLDSVCSFQVLVAWTSSLIILTCTVPVLSAG